MLVEYLYKYEEAFSLVYHARTQDLRCPHYEENPMVDALEMQEDGTTLSVNINRESLLPDRVFCVIDNTNKNVYIWLGKEANVRKRFVGAQVAGRIRGELSTGFRVRSLDQGDEPVDFFNSLKKD
jgi:hypothetical protein